MCSSECGVLLRHLNEMRITGEMCDVKITSRSSSGGTAGQEFFAHMNVLAASSPHFRSMFNSEFKEAVVGAVGLDMEAGTVELLLEYLYTRHLVIDEEKALRLLPEANYLQLDALKDSCVKVLLECVSASNCLDIWQATRLFPCNQINKLCERAWLTACYNFDDVIDTPSFISLEKTDLVKLISDVRLCCRESNVFIGECRWVRGGEGREQHMHELLSLVRLSKLDSRFLVETVGIEPLVTANPACFQLYFAAMKAMILDSHRVGSDRFGRFERIARLPDRITDKLRCFHADGNIYVTSHGRVSVGRLSDTGDITVWDVFSSLPTNEDYHLFVVNEVVYAVHIRERVEVWKYTDAWKIHWSGVFKSALTSDTIVSSCVNEGQMYLAVRDHARIWKHDPSGAAGVSAFGVPASLKDGFSMCAIDGNLVLIGGFDKDNVETDKVHCYNLTTSTWSDWPPLPQPLSHAAVVKCDGRLVVGGGSNKGTAQTSVLMLVDGVWQSLPSLTYPRHSAGMLCSGKYVYVLGGSNSAGEVVRSVEKLLIT